MGMFKEKKRLFSIVIALGLMLCSVADVMGQQHMELLEKAVTELSGYRNPFGGLIPPRWGQVGPPEWDPPPGLDKKEAVPFLIEVLKNGPEGSEILSGELYSRLAQCYTALCLGAMKDSRAREPLIDAMKTVDEGDQRAYVSRTAALALGLSGDSLAIGPLVEALADKRPKVRGGAARALSWLVEREGAAIVAIRGVAESDTNIFVRLAGLRALRQIEARLEKLKDSQKEEKE